MALFNLSMFWNRTLLLKEMLNYKDRLQTATKICINFSMYPCHKTIPLC